MNSLSLVDFENYFRELHGHPPYDWQARLAEKAISGSWPDVIDLPTGSGKTACVDIAVFALACQASLPLKKRTAPRRVFFCVNRRVIVDEAHHRALGIAKKLVDAEGRENQTILARVAQSLRQISTLRKESAPPLDVLELRGGIYRDNRWARSATQPTIVCTTIDQLGSRLLFRGYGVSPNAAPIQAALIAYDSLVLLDEAHISRPFLQTLNFVRGYLDPERWAKQRLGIPSMKVAPMTATPPNAGEMDVIRLTGKDRKNPGLDNRLKASKPATLISVSDVVDAAVAQAESLARSRPTAVGIIVNRVAKARAIYEQLKARNPDVVVELVIGSMRPLDRDDQADRFEPLIGSTRPTVTTHTSFVIATQCLEVGADYDFDVLVTECASLDALRQRFGRLNRAGREIDAQAVILIDGQQVQDEADLDEEKPLDPIYGNALSRTWNWLTAHAEAVQSQQGMGPAAAPRRRRSAQSVSEVRRVNFGIDRFGDLVERHCKSGVPSNLLAPSASSSAPVMLPAYVDFWCQTSPQPTSEPDVSLFIHGSQSGEPDLQVCWRADLDNKHISRDDWCDVVGLLPPTAAECMTVPISRLRRWIGDQSETTEDGDLLGAPNPDEADDPKKNRRKDEVNPSRRGVLWRGAKKGMSKILDSLNDLRPGDTLVLPAMARGWNDLGHVPDTTPDTIDIAERAFTQAKDRAALRLHPVFASRLTASLALAEIVSRCSDPDQSLAVHELRGLLNQAATELASNGADLATTCRNLLDTGLIRENYPDSRGLVLTTRRRLGSASSWQMPVADDGEDEYSRTTRRTAIPLESHTGHVRDEILRAVAALPLNGLAAAFESAAKLHDLGKADERFQAMLRRAGRTDAWLLAGVPSALLAKSDGMPLTPQQRREARERAGLPEGFRHEMLSTQIAELGKTLPGDAEGGDLILHLIASHHGYARPFAPLVVDADPPNVMVNGLSVTTDARSKCPLHRIDSGIAERFWQMTRRYGWWGLAYLEAVLRLADQQASADEDADVLSSESLEFLGASQ